MINFNFDAQIKKLEYKKQLIANLALYYADLMISDLMGSYIDIDIEDDIDEFIFSDDDTFNSFKDAYLNLLNDTDTIGFEILYKSNVYSIVDKLNEYNKILGKYAELYYSDVERILSNVY
jgi:hypothetical protein